MFAFFAILILSSWLLSSRRLLLSLHWLLRSPYIVIVSPFENPLFGWVKVRSLFVFEGAFFPFAARFANVWARTGDVFIVRGESLGISYLASYIDVLEYRHWRPSSFGFGTEGVVALLNIHASLRSLGNMLSRLLVSTRLVPGMFRLAWRLIRVRFCLASAWPIRLGIIQARVAVAFAVDGTHRNFPGQCSCCSCVEAVVILDLFAVILDSLFGSDWIYVVRGV